MYGYDTDYINVNEMRELLLYEKIVDIDEDKITLGNGAIVSIECTESDCCAGGGGHFEWESDTLEAVITDVKVGEEQEVPDDDTYVSTNTITIYHNQNAIVKANATTDAGNGGHYYSVTSLRIKDVYFPFVRA